MHVLIVEDDPGLAEMIARYLEPVADEVQIAYTMAEAERAMAEAKELHLITLDLNLPDSRVNETLDAIPRLRKVHPDALIIVLTAMVDPHRELEVLDAGADGYMYKQLLRYGQPRLLSTLRDVVFSVIKRPNRFQQSVGLLEKVAVKIAGHLTENHQSNPTTK